MGKRSAKHETAAQEKAIEARPLPESPKGDLLPILTIIAAWLVMEVLVDPRGDFPLNDDWCYARSVLVLLKEHKLRLLGIVPMTLVAQVVWGALFCLVLGATHTALRISTVVLGLGGLLATYGLLREARVLRWIAVIGCMIVAVNPLYFELSNTFMTDVPFSAVVLMSMYLYVRALRRDSAIELVAATVLACIATLIRQLGLMLPLSFAVACLVTNGFRARAIVRSAVPVVIVLAVLIAYQEWLKLNGLMPSYYSKQAHMYKMFTSSGWDFWILGITHVARCSFVYFGLFAFPFLMLAYGRSWEAISRKLKTANTIVAVICSSAVLIWMLVRNEWMPLKKAGGDCLLDLGVGPSLLTDQFLKRMNHLPTAPTWFWVTVSLVGVVGGGLLIRHLLSAAEALFIQKSKSVSPFDRGYIAFVLAAVFLYLAPIVSLTAMVYFDRYFLCAVPLVLVLIALTGGLSARLDRWDITSALVVILLFGAFSVGAVHDYLEWNRTRWTALGVLVLRDGVSANRIDGGYEFNGWYHYRGVDQHWWRVIRDDYMISFGPVPGYKVIERYPYRRWMPPGEGQILVLRKIIHL